MASQPLDLSFKLLDLLSRERGAYGLRNGDHERYRHHCTNKLHRLRQVTGLTSGKGKVYKKPTPVSESTVKDLRHLHLLLFSAERAIAHSHELKAVIVKNKIQAIPSFNARKDQISWLRRALKFSTSLHNITAALASSERDDATSVYVSQQTLAEVTIYHLSIRAELAFEKASWAESITDLAARRKLLGTLADSARDSYDQALANEFIDSYDPLIRFAAYKLGRAESHDIEGVVADIDDEMMEESVPGMTKLIQSLRSEVGADDIEAGRKTLEDVEFAGDKIELRFAEIVQVMLRVQEFVGRLKSKSESGKGRDMRGWDKVLSILGEAEGLARKVLDDHEASSTTTSLRSAKTSQSLSLAHQYIVYLLLSHRIRRDLLLVETMNSALPIANDDITNFKVSGGRARVEQAVKALAAIVKLYDTVLQSMSQLRSLAIVEEKEGVRRGAEGVEAFFHATRCFNLARLHCIHPTPSFASAIRLTARATKLLEQSQTALFTPDAPPLQEEVIHLSENQVETLVSQVSTLELAAKRALFAQRITKPVFFDTAFNYVDLPMDDLLVLAGKKDASVLAKEKENATSTAGHVVAGAVGKANDVAQSAVNEVAKRSGLREKTREATPGLSGDDEEMKEGDVKPKGWLGGWFGRR